MLAAGNQPRSALPMFSLSHVRRNVSPVPGTVCHRASADSGHSGCVAPGSAAASAAASTGSKQTRADEGDGAEVGVQAGEGSAATQM
jgi:hypothetical protein